MDSGWLVRNIDLDGDPNFAMRQIDPVLKLKAAHAAIQKAEGK